MHFSGYFSGFIFWAVGCKIGKDGAGFAGLLSPIAFILVFRRRVVGDTYIPLIFSSVGDFEVFYPLRSVGLLVPLFLNKADGFLNILD